jgi:hypothetical protein
MRALEPYVRPVLMAAVTCLWLFLALGFGVFEERPLLGIVMVLLAGVFFQTVGWEMLLPMRDYSCRVTPPARAETVKAAPPRVESPDGDSPSPNRARRPPDDRISRLQLQHWPCRPTVH